MSEEQEPADVQPAREVPGPVYLGDAVYAGFDGFHLTLMLNAHDSYPVVFIERDVYDALKSYAKRVGWEA